MTISIVLIEEPASKWGRDTKILSHLEIPPKKESMEKILSCTEEYAKWQPTKIYSWINEPAISCGKAIANKMKIKHTACEDLLPLDMGAWTALDWVEVQERFARTYRRWRANPYKFTPPLGESMYEVECRVEHLMEEIRMNAENIIVLASAEVLTVFCNKVLPKFGATISFGTELEGDNPSIWQLFDFKKGWMVWDLLVDDEG